ncbi:hypothetical protein EGI15_00325 [Chryseobacterium cucumeris]|uniref:Uncharacterized protein n=1 Tax=Chryseobacterium cucumeris TaxID=1813611 RepID=A0ABX9XBR1_9FLAO|nr:hypothetical protein [Chryseobacterium cucumeris]ROH96947.1 hypothetical protein EGI15_00325 [Chryseobacterium cucumeris]
MKTSKDTIEFQIKKQIEEREITPSRNLWSEIELQNNNSHRFKSKMNWFLVAACLMLTFGLGTVLFFLNQPSEIEPVMVKTAEKASSDKMGTDSIHDNISLAAQNNEKKDENQTSRSDKAEGISAVAIAQTPLIPKENPPLKKLDITQISNPKMMAKADSIKTPVKKKKYVDPSTLLFSVEHKDVIEKTKDGSNVATIDLNAR